MTTTKKIMIADDDPGIVDAIEMMLTYEGYEVKTTSNGATFSEVKKNNPDLVLLDIWMSGEDGREICRKIKATKQTKAIPVIIISASKDIERSAIDSGADGFLEKPFEMNELLDKIKALLAT
jgi:DNA-binding response OmpR family regulator